MREEGSRRGGAVTPMMGCWWRATAVRGWEKERDSVREREKGREMSSTRPVPPPATEMEGAGCIDILREETRGEMIKQNYDA